MCIVNSEKLKNLRIQLRLTQKQFAEKVKLSISEYSKLERNEIDNPGITWIYNIAEFCTSQGIKTSIDWLCDRMELHHHPGEVELIESIRKRRGFLKKLLNIFHSEDNLAMFEIIVELLNDKNKIKVVYDIVTK